MSKWPYNDLNWRILTRTGPAMRSCLAPLFPERSIGSGMALLRSLDEKRLSRSESMRATHSSKLVGR